jgi:hypothetical protein
MALKKYCQLEQDMGSFERLVKYVATGKVRSAYSVTPAQTPRKKKTPKLLNEAFILANCEAGLRTEFPHALSVG